MRALQTAQAPDDPEFYRERAEFSLVLATHRQTTTKLPDKSAGLPLANRSGTPESIRSSVFEKCSSWSYFLANEAFTLAGSNSSFVATFWASASPNNSRTTCNDAS